MGFSAEQLAKWVAERTDVHVGSFYFIFFRWIVLEMLVLIILNVKALKIHITFTI